MNKLFKKRVKSILSRRKLIALFVFSVFCFTLLFSNTVFASEGSDAISGKFDSLRGIVEAVVTAIGTLVTLWGIAEWGLAYQSNDGMMQSGAWKKIAGGLIMLLAPTLLTLLTSA